MIFKMNNHNDLDYLRNNFKIITRFIQCKYI
jgi:hypothetical protein